MNLLYSISTYSISTCILFALLYGRDNFILYILMAKKWETKKVVTTEPIEDNTPKKVVSKIKSKEKKTKKVKSSKIKTPTVKTAANKVSKYIYTPAKAEKKIITPQTKDIKAKKDPLVTIAEFLWSVKTKHLSDVLFDLMTEKEIQEFAERIEILRLLQKWVTQRVIAKNLGISVTTVSRWSKVLQTGKERIKKYL